MLCEEGGAVDFFLSGAPGRDGKTPVNVSGGLRVEGPSHRGHRHRQHLGGLPPPPRRGRRPSDRGRQGRPGPRHRPRLGVRRPRPGGVGASDLRPQHRVPIPTTARSSGRSCRVVRRLLLPQGGYVPRASRGKAVASQGGPASRRMLTSCASTGEEDVSCEAFQHGQQLLAGLLVVGSPGGVRGRLRAPARPR